MPNSVDKYFRLHGKVRSLRIEKMKFDGPPPKEIQGPRWLSEEKQYDVDGRELEAVSYREDGSLIERRRYFYDSNRKLAKFVKYDSEGSLSEEVIFQTDEQGRDTVSCYAADGSLTRRSVHSSSSPGRRESTYHAPPSGSDYRVVELYDSAGMCTERVEYDLSGSVKNKDIHIFDRNGEEVEWILYEGDSLLSREIYTYDHERNEIKSEAYDDKGELESKSCTRYEIDSHGNWTKKTEVHRNIVGESYDEFTIITYRTIRYHDGADL